MEVGDSLPKWADFQHGAGTIAGRSARYTSCGYIGVSRGAGLRSVTKMPTASGRREQVASTVSVLGAAASISSPHGPTVVCDGEAPAKTCG